MNVFEKLIIAFGITIFLSSCQFFVNKNDETRKKTLSLLSKVIGENFNFENILIQNDKSNSNDKQFKAVISENKNEIGELKITFEIDEKLASKKIEFHKVQALNLLTTKDSAYPGMISAEVSSDCLNSYYLKEHSSDIFKGFDTLAISSKAESIQVCSNLEKFKILSKKTQYCINEKVLIEFYISNRSQKLNLANLKNQFDCTFNYIELIK